MKMYVISDNLDTLLGMRLCGVEGEVVHEKEALERALERALSDKELAVLLVTEKLSLSVPEKITQIKLSHKTPLLVEIPTRSKPSKSTSAITQYVLEAIGVKLN